VRDKAISSIEDFGSKAESLFGVLPMNMQQVTQFVAECQKKLEGLRNLVAVSRLPFTAISAINTLIQGVFVDVNALLAVPGYANAIRSIYNSIVAGTLNLASYDRASTIRRITGQQTEIVAARETNKTLMANLAATDKTLAVNFTANDELHQSLAVAAAAEIALDDYLTSDDRDAALAGVTDAIDALLPGMPDEIFNEAMEMRTAVILALLSQDLRTTVTRQVANPLPTILLSHRMQVENETFIARNKIRHPLFVSGAVYG